VEKSGRIEYQMSGKLNSKFLQDPATTKAFPWQNRESDSKVDEAVIIFIHFYERHGNKALLLVIEKQPQK